MNISDLTADEDAAFVNLRKWHNRDNPNNQLTKAQLVEAYAKQAWQNAVKEAAERLTSSEFQNAWKAATEETKTQVRTILNL